MAADEILKRQILLVLLILSVLKNIVTEQSPSEPALGFDLDQTELHKMILMDTGPAGNQDLIDNAMNIPNDKLTRIQKDEKGLLGDNTSQFEPPWDLKTLFIPYGGSDLCDKHTQLYLSYLKKWEKWAVQMWDATGKIGAGLFSGNGNQLGDFDTCLSVIGPEDFQPNYCLAAIDLTLLADAPSVVKEIVTKIRGDNFVRSVRNDPGHFIPRFTTLGWGICVPKSCSKESLEAGLVNALKPLNSTPGLIVHTALPEYACHEELDHLSLPTIFTLLFFASVLFIALLATVVDLFNDGCLSEITDNENRLLMAFSMRRNLKDLFADGHDEFPCIHGIRALCTILLYVAHRLIPISAILYSNRVLITQHANTIWSSLLRASNMYTDSFLFLSAVLTSYSLTKDFVTKGYIKGFMRLVTRLIRLTPPLLAVLLYYAYVMEHTGSGPQWGTLVKASADICKRNLWRNLFYIQNFYEFEEMCGPHTHQLALDMQMFILAPAIVYILHLEQFLGFTLMVSIAGASAALRFYTIYTYNLSTYIQHGVTVQDLYKNANLSYSQTIHRIIPYLIGIGLGYSLYKYKKLICTNAKAAIFGWTVCLTGIIYSLFSQSPLAMKDHVYDPFDAALYAAISPFIWSISLCWVILMCCTNQGGPVGKFLESRFFLLVSRLSFSFYLTQFIAFHYNSGVVRATEPGTVLAIVPIWELITVILMSILVTLIFDLPMQEIKSIILSGSKRKLNNIKPD